MLCEGLLLAGLAVLSFPLMASAKATSDVAKARKAARAKQRYQERKAWRESSKFDFGGSVEHMTRQDAFSVREYERNAKLGSLEMELEAKGITSKEAIQKEIVRRLQSQAGNKNIIIDDYEGPATDVPGSVGGVSYRDLDGTFGKPKDSRFDGLIAGLNETTAHQLHHMENKYLNDRHSQDRAFQDRVEAITAGYSTRELGRFVSEEMGYTRYVKPNKWGIKLKGGRKEYITTIQLELQHRFVLPGSGIYSRTTLSAPTSRLASAASSIEQSIDVANVYRDRAMAIREKYRPKS